MTTETENTVSSKKFIDMVHADLRDRRRGDSTIRQRLTGHLLDIYFTSAGDAGLDRQIFQFHKYMDEHPNSPVEALESGKSCTIQFEGREVTQTEYFQFLADKILFDLITEAKHAIEAKALIKTDDL